MAVNIGYETNPLYKDNTNAMLDQLAALFGNIGDDFEMVPGWADEYGGRGGGYATSQAVNDLFGQLGWDLPSQLGHPQLYSANPAANTAALTPLYNLTPQEGYIDYWGGGTGLYGPASNVPLPDNMAGVDAALSGYQLTLPDMQNLDRDDRKPGNFFLTYDPTGALTDIKWENQKLSDGFLADNLGLIAPLLVAFAAPAAFGALGGMTGAAGAGSLSALGLADASPLAADMFATGAGAGAGAGAGGMSALGLANASNLAADMFAANLSDAAVGQLAAAGWGDVGLGFGSLSALSPAIDSILGSALTEAGLSGVTGAPISASTPSTVIPEGGAGGAGAGAGGAAGAAGGGGILDTLSKIGTGLGGVSTLASLLGGGALGAQIGSQYKDMVSNYESQLKDMQDAIADIPNMWEQAVGGLDFNFSMPDMGQLTEMLGQIPSLGDLNLNLPAFEGWGGAEGNIFAGANPSRGMQSGGHPLIELLERNRLLNANETDLTGGAGRNSRVGINRLFGMLG